MRRAGRHPMLDSADTGASTRVRADPPGRPRRSPNASVRPGEWPPVDDPATPPPLDELAALPAPAKAVPGDTALPGDAALPGDTALTEARALPGDAALTEPRALPGDAALPGAPSAEPRASPDRERIDFERARDKALVEVALDGDLDAFNRLVEFHQDHLFGVAFRVVGDREAAADAVQEAFLSAYRNLARFRGDSFRSWLTRITVNAATDVLRTRKRRPADPFPEWEDDTWQPPADESEGPEQRAIVRLRSQTITQALGQITEDQRVAIVLFDVEGYDYQEIADMTGVSLGTVKSRIHRGRLALRDLLVDHMDLLRG